MSEHVCEKKTKSSGLSESSCSVLSEISGSEMKQHSFHTELSPSLTTNFPGLEKQPIAQGADVGGADFISVLVWFGLAWFCSVWGPESSAPWLTAGTPWEEVVTAPLPLI